MPDKRPFVPEHASPAEVEAVMARMTRRSFATGAVAAIIGGAGVRWVATQSTDAGLPWPLRRVLELNESVAQSIYSPGRLAPEFALRQVQPLRVNGMVGLSDQVSTDNWTVRITGLVDRVLPLSVIKELPIHEMVTEFKCVEGWSRIFRWKGVRLADLLAKFGTSASYVGLSTPSIVRNGNESEDRYYVGLDRPSAEHPQTLLCFEMNGEPLTAKHGAPLRLVSTVKYGFKCIKRIGVIELTDRRPKDYWAQRGYDWYAGL